MQRSSGHYRKKRKSQKECNTLGSVALLTPISLSYCFNRKANNNIILPYKTKRETQLKQFKDRKCYWRERSIQARQNRKKKGEKGREEGSSSRERERRKGLKVRVSPRLSAMLLTTRLLMTLTNSWVLICGLLHLRFLYV